MDMMHYDNMISFLTTNAAQVTHYMTWTLGIVSVTTFVALHFISAPYGKHVRDGFGPRMDARLGWFLQEVPSFFTAAVMTYHACIATSSFSVLLPNFMLMALYCVHYFQRSFIYPFLMRGSHSTPILVNMIALCFCAFNGLLQSLDILYVAKYSEDYYKHPQFLVGAGIFFAGLYVNIYSDHILRNLRKPGDSGYYIPQGGMYSLVSSANYTGETLEWLGFTVAVGRLPALMFFLFTVSNLMPRARDNHRWYQIKFKETYPKHRKAYIPFLL